MMGYRKLVDKDDAYINVPGPAKDNNADRRGDPTKVGGQVPGTGEKGTTPDGEKSNRGNSEYRR